MGPDATVDEISLQIYKVSWVGARRNGNEIIGISKMGKVLQRRKEFCIVI